MASIRKRGTSQYQARIRIKGYPDVTRTFPTKSEAVKWSADREGLLIQWLGRAQDMADRLTLSDAPTM